MFTFWIPCVCSPEDGYLFTYYWGILGYYTFWSQSWFNMIYHHLISCHISFPHHFPITQYIQYIYILIYVYKCHKIVISHGFRPHVKTGPFPSSSPRDVTSADATCLQGGAQLATARIDFGPSSPDGKKHQKWWFNHGKLWFNRI